jgi:TonB-dependent starch-binding outer membrane protein SusC
VIKKSDLTWNSRLNYTTYKTHFEELSKDVSASYIGETNMGTPGQEQTQITRAIVGEDIGVIWGKKFIRVDENGKYLYEDTNKDGKVDNTDVSIIGHGLPKFEFGWSNTVKYKSFDFNFLLRGSIGHDLANSYRAFYETPTVKGQYNIVNTKYFDPTINDVQEFSSLHVEKASFVKLDNATLGYNFNIGSGDLIKSIRAFVTAQNLFIITDYTGVDPEVRYSDNSTNNLGVFTQNVLAPGIDRREVWARTRSFSVGVNVQF